MIDKSIRQHYQTGDKVKKLGYDVGQKLMSPLKDKYIAQDTGKIKKGQIAKDIGISFAKKAVARKLGVASLNPILGLLSLMGIDPISWLSKKMTEGGVQQAFTAGMTGTQADRESAKELRQLEKRRDYMLQRKEAGKNYSEKNLDMVTRAIAEAKGLDINNPNEMKNIDKPIQQIQIEKRVTEPQIIPETPEIISPHLLDKTITPKKTVEETAAMEDIIIRPTVVDTAATEDIITPPSKPKPKHVPHQYRGGNGGGGGSGGHRGGAPSHSTRSLMSKGGRVDKALGGRVRDI